MCFFMFRAGLGSSETGFWVGYLFFDVFGRVPASLLWPKEVWPLLVQCKLVGKVFSTLCLEGSLKYKVKSTILGSYEVVPEAYRQHCCSRSKSNLCRVCTGKDHSLISGLLIMMCELLLLEEIKNCLFDCVVVCLNEQKVTTLKATAVATEEFYLTQKKECICE